MDKKSKTQLQDYLKDLTAVGETSSEQTEAMDGGHPEQDKQADNPSPKRSLSLPNLPSKTLAPSETLEEETSFDHWNQSFNEDLAVAVDNNSEPAPKTRRPRKRWWLGGVFILLVAGTAITLPKAIEMVNGWRQEAQFKAYEQEQHQDSEVLKLALLPPAERDPRLQAIANQGELSLDRSRARFLLATDLLANFEGGRPSECWKGWRWTIRF